MSLMSTGLVFATVLAFTFLVNLPFGYWRAGTRARSLAWAVAVHAPVPLIAAFRLALGMGWQWSLLPFTAVAYLAGQMAGGRLRPRTG